jgi:hypothetical protein
MVIIPLVIPAGRAGKLKVTAPLNVTMYMLFNG